MPKPPTHKSFLLVTTLLFMTTLYFQVSNFRHYPSGFLFYSIFAVFISAFLGGLSFFISFKLLKQPQRFETNYLQPFLNWIKHPERLLACFLTAFLTVFLLAFSAGMFLSRLSKYLGDWVAIFYRIQPLYWAVLGFLLLFLIWVFLNFWKELFSKQFWKFDVILKILVFFLIFSFTLMHWGILFYQVRIFKMIPGWFWGFKVKEFTSRDFLFLLYFGLSLLCVSFILKSRKNWKRNLLILILLGYVLQTGFGFIEGQGFESIRLKFAASTHKGYAEHAADRPVLSDILLNYEEKYGWDHYLGTKPPGVMFLYSSLQKLSNLVLPVETFDERVLRLTSVMAYLFPLFSMLVLVLLFNFSRFFLKEEDAILPCILFVFCPNVLLMPLFFDQVLYPALFLFGMFLFGKIIQKRSHGLAFLTGIYIYTAMYFTFSMLPMLAFGCLWVALDYFFHMKERNFLTTLGLGMAVMAGCALMFLIFRQFLNYDIVLRYRSAFEIHKSIKLLEPGFKNWVLYFLLNNVEFSAWTGFSLIFLLLAGAAKIIKRIPEKNFSNLDIFLLTSLGTYLAMNIFSQTRGEVGRIWIFWVPFVSLLAAGQLKGLFKKESAGFLMTVSLQLITAFLTFHFQDFIT